MEASNAFAKLMIKAYKDPKFKEQLLKNPEAVLAENGIEIPKGKKIEVHENTEQVHHLVLPILPQNLSDKELEQLTGGWDMMDTIKAIEKDFPAIRDQV